MKGYKDVKINGKITKRFGREVTIDSQDEGFRTITLNMDNICAEFIPVVGKQIREYKTG